MGPRCKLGERSNYNLAVIGGGLAGLSALYHLQRAGKLAGKSVVLIDPERKSGHDRSWSFWEKGSGPFEDIVYHRWPTVTLHNSSQQRTCDLRPYVYKMIRSTEFYELVNPVINSIEDFTHLPTTASNVKTVEDGVVFTVDGQEIRADYAFTSQPWPLHHEEVAEPYLDQHFRGWFIETEVDTFDPEVAALMDFRTEQHDETRFFYVMPFSKRRAMVEIAIFSNDHLTVTGYDELIKEYIHAHWTTGNYRIEHTESGNIPMTTYPFPQRDGNLIYIGLGGGAARPSTGYTFYGLQRQLVKMAASFPDLNNLAPWPLRHLHYDATILRILQERQLKGDNLFVDLFVKNPPRRVLAFLNGESSFLEEVKLMNSTPILTFGKSFVREVLRATFSPDHLSP